MLNQRLAACMAVLALALGCNAVYVTEPVGPPAVELKPEEWEGTWEAGGERESIHIAVADAAEGKLNFAMIESSDHEFELSKGVVYARPAGADEWFLTSQDNDKSTTDPQRLVFMGLVKKSDDIAVLWPADAAGIVGQIEAGKMPGTSKNDDAYLGKLSPAQLDALTTPPAMLLHWKEPVSFMKLRK